MRVAVVFGGVSEEREISLLTGAAVCEALRKRGHTVWEIEAFDPLPSEETLGVLYRADAVFLALHGGTGENGAWQTALEGAGICHYTGSGPAAAALAMDKVAAKAAVAAFGVPVARAFGAGDVPSSFPLVVKPRYGGSSIGLCFLEDEAAFLATPPGEGELCEAFLPGREYSVGVLAGRALPPVLICPADGVYDYAHKYARGGALEICPSPKEANARLCLQNLALVCFAALGLRDYARIDFREDGEGKPVFMEANTLPGMTATSLFPLAARAAGMEMGELCEKMVCFAAERRQSVTTENA